MVMNAIELSSYIASFLCIECSWEQYPQMLYRIHAAARMCMSMYVWECARGFASRKWPHAHQTIDENLLRWMQACTLQWRRRHANANVFTLWIVVGSGKSRRGQRLVILFVRQVYFSLSFETIYEFARFSVCICLCDVANYSSWLLIIVPFRHYHYYYLISLIHIVRSFLLRVKCLRFCSANRSDAGKSIKCNCKRTAWNEFEFNLQCELRRFLAEKKTELIETSTNFALRWHTLRRSIECTFFDSRVCASYHIGVCSTCECSRDFYADFYCSLVNCAPRLNWNKRWFDEKPSTRSTFINKTFGSSQTKRKWNLLPIKWPPPAESIHLYHRSNHCLIFSGFQFNKTQKIGFLHVLMIISDTIWYS